MHDKVVGVIAKPGRCDPQQLAQLTRVFKREDPAEVFEGLFSVLTSDRRFVTQEFAGRLLLEVSPKCPRTDLDNMLIALLPVWELSVEQVPWYFQREFGTPDLGDALRRVADRKLPPEERKALQTFAWWIRFELDDTDGGLGV